MGNNQISGNISEYRTVVDLMRKGYYVYIQATQCSPFDLITEKDGKLLKIEVRTGRYGGNGNVYHNPTSKHQYDILATVLPDRVMYTPEI